MSAGQPRIAALWFPDWPIQAAQIEDSSLTGPIILVRNHHVEVCNRAARAAGVKRGMRLRQAQAICSEATVVEANEDRDGALFTAIATSLDDVASSVEVLRPGWSSWMRVPRRAFMGKVRWRCSLIRWRAGAWTPPRAWRMRLPRRSSQRATRRRGMWWRGVHRKTS